MKRFDIIIFLNIFLLFIISNFLQGCTLKDKLTGYLLIPMSTALDQNVGIFTIDLKNNEQLNKYFLDKKYKYVSFPVMKDGNLYCIAQNTKDNYYAIVEIKENRVSEIIKSDRKIISYSIEPNEKIVFIQEQNSRSYIFSKSAQGGRITRLYDGEIDEESKPIIDSDGSVIFVSRDDRIFNIKRVHDNGEIKSLVNGRYPLLMNAGTDLIYYKSRSIMRYNLSNRKEKRIKSDITLEETPVLSPDEKYLAFFEIDYVSTFGGEWTDFLSIMSLNSREKRHIKAYNKARIRLTLSGIDWVDNK
ncbi:hypothetical protein EDC14_10631 [Hydrogenispora ethanolica]|uniref:TolB protein n=1 Tax=Hydrogenispora ethanolica TaxID=1082276 RepID=A0A4R1QU92_HYDET|nr:hypothetical protein [Hydrogenispora ethanolica]TCL54484.1 hypothetical protein EDC14_10631 [Hydrogenispora ethanolica]